MGKEWARKLMTNLTSYLMLNEIYSGPTNHEAQNKGFFMLMISKDAA